MLGVRRASLVRQMAFRQDSNDTELSVRHGHLAAPMAIPDSPRPQKDDGKDGLSPPSLSVVMPVPKSTSTSDSSSPSTSAQPKEKRK